MCSKRLLPWAWKYIHIDGNSKVILIGYVNSYMHSVVGVLSKASPYFD
jgi:hypothetical protein